MLKSITSSAKGKSYKNAHIVLSFLSKLLWRQTTDENGNQIHKPLGFSRKTAKELSEHLNMDLNTIVYAINLLKENNHVSVLNADDWNEIRAAATISGMQASDEGYYIELKLYEDANYAKAFKDKNWIWIAIVGGVIGYALGWLLPIKQREPRTKSPSAKTQVHTQTFAFDNSSLYLQPSVAAFGE